MFLTLALLGFVLGCGRPAAEAPERTRPRPNAPAAYGPPGQSVLSSTARVQKVSLNHWTNAGLVIVQTELSPAVLVRAKARHLDLFAGSTNAGLGAPTFITWTTMNGPRTFKRDEALDLEKTKLEECWLLVWWAGAEGWTNWDVPWVVYLQHKPQQLKLDAGGLHLDFPGAAGDVVLLPLYGYEKLPQRGRDLLAEHGMTGRKVKTWDWPEVLKREPLTRIRYWAAVTRELPMQNDESFKTDSGADTVTFRSRFTWHRIDDDWNTPHLKLAPVSPALSLAVKLGFPARFSKSWFDLDYFTAYGPYLAVEGVDQFEVTLPVLQYVHETERTPPAAADASGAVREAGEELEKRMAGFGFGSSFSSAGEGAHSLSNLWALNHYTRALAYCSPAVRSNAAGALGRYFREVLLNTNAFASVEASANGERIERVARDYVYVSGASSSYGKVAHALLFQALWAYSHFSGDWDLPREHWPLLSSLSGMAATAPWRSLVANGPAGNGDLAGGCIALARLAYRAGDMKRYHEACAQLAGELAALVIKQRGAEFFRKHQPYHSMEFMDDEVFPTETKAGHGWVLDGPRFPAGATPGERSFFKRWARFCDLDVARFCREYLGPDIRRELIWLQHLPDIARPEMTHDELPSFLYLRSLLLQEEAGLGATNDTKKVGGLASGTLEDCLAMLRARTPVEFQRLIPPFTSPGWLPRPQRAADETADGLVCTVADEHLGEVGGTGRGWPGLVWEPWKSPNGQRWTFGTIGTGAHSVSSAPHVFSLGNTTSVLVYDSGL